MKNIEKNNVIRKRLQLGCMGVLLIILGLVVVHIHSCMMVYDILFDRKDLGVKIGKIEVTVDSRKTVHSVFRVRAYDDLISPLGDCLIIYKVPVSKDFLFGVRSLKVGPDWVAIFNDSWTECLPLGKWIFMSDMTYSTFFVEGDMKGMDAKYEVAEEEAFLHYRIEPGGGPYTSMIEFRIPKIWLNGIPVRKPFPGRKQENKKVIALPRRFWKDIDMSSWVE